MTIGAFSRNIKVSNFKLVSENLPFHSSAVNIICQFATVGMTTQNFLRSQHTISTVTYSTTHCQAILIYFRPLRWKTRRLTLIWSPTRDPQSTQQSFNITCHGGNINSRRVTYARPHELWTVECICVFCNGVRMFMNKTSNVEHCGASVSQCCIELKY